jgi:ParB-like chromosome segregation protein Spo0J
MSEIGVSEISSAFPEMDDAAFAALRDDIARHGQLVPIVVIHGEVIDGRKRLAACRDLGIEPRITEIAGVEAEEAAASLNLLRTHYSPSQRAMYGRRLANMSGGRPRGEDKPSKFGEFPERVSLRAAAKRVGVSQSQVSAAKAVAAAAIPEVTEAVEQGKIAINAATKIVKANSHEKQFAALKKAMERNPKSGVPSTNILKRSKLRSNYERGERSLSAIETAIEVLLENWEKGDVEWQQRLRKVRAVISRLLGRERRESRGRK